jgi:hypothetical protein
MLRRSGDLAQAGEAFTAVDDPEQMPADAVVFEELGVGLEPVADDRRSFGRLVDFDEDEGRGLAGIDGDEVVGVDAPVPARNVVLGPPELDEPGIVANERGDELDAVERVAGRDQARRSIGVEVDTASAG